ncbi:MAG: TonB-dependent receptor [Deltaproteobacteria bacterium]|jgi:iron complex outermembrane receptor protein|nr:TonB-dependent receptor [Deltaproteobacteria bacterium]
METPASVNIVNGDDVRKENYSSINDALKKQAGFYYDEARGNLQVRGQDTSNVQVLVDGVPSFSPFDNDGLLDSIPLFNIDKVEVLKGASSSLFGGNAVAGVINVTTREPESNQFKVKVGYGSENTRYGAFDAYVRGDKIGFGFGYEFKKTDGYRQRYAVGTVGTTAPHTIGYGAIPAKGEHGDQYFVGNRGEKGYEKHNIWFNVKYDFTDSLSVKYNLSYYLYEATSQKPETYIRDANGNPLFIGSVAVPGGWANFTESAFTEYLNRSEVMRNGLQIIDTDHNITANLGLSLVMDDGYISGSSLGPGVGTKVAYPGKTFNIDFQKEWDNLGRHRIVAGFTLRQDQMKYDSYVLRDWHDINTQDRLNLHSQGKDQIAAVFVQDEIDITDKLKLFAGLRFDYYRNFDGRADYYQHGEDLHLQFPAQTYSQLSPKVSLQYNPTDQLSIYVSYGHAFRPPELYQLFRMTDYNPTSGPTSHYYVGNPWLKPEKSDTIEFGVKSQYFDTDFELSVFQTTTSDAIVAVDYPPGTFPYAFDQKQLARAYTNVYKEKRYGLEVSVSRDLGEYFDAFANYTWQKGEYTGGPVSGQIIDDIPRHMFNFGVDFQYKNLELSFVGRYSSRLGASDTPTGIFDYSYDPHFLADVTANLTLYDNYQLTLSVTNLFDEHYYQYYVAPGRRIMLSLTATFE